MLLVIVIRHTCGLQEYEVFPESNEVMLCFLIILFVITPLVILPKGVAYCVDHLTNRYIMRKDLHQLLGIQSGYEVPGIKHGSCMFLPQSFCDYRNPNSSLAIVMQNSFNSHDSSRHFYRLRFKVHTWNKIFMHFFYLSFSGVCLHLLAILFEHSGITKVVFHLWVLQVPVVTILGKM